MALVKEVFGEAEQTKKSAKELHLRANCSRAQTLYLRCRQDNILGDSAGIESRTRANQPPNLPIQESDKSQEKSFIRFSV